MTLLAFSSCRKEEGLGGKSHIMVNVIQGEEAIPGAIVYIGFGDTLEKESLDLYDYYDTTDYSGQIDVKHLTRSDYFFYTEYPGMVDTMPVTFKGSNTLKVTNKHSSYHVVLDCEPDL